MFLAATLEDGWKVGDTLWKYLTREQRSKLISMRREAMSQKNPFSQGERFEPQKQQPNAGKTLDSRFKETTSILKPPQKLPKQYSENEAKTNLATVPDDDDPDTKDTIKMMLSRYNSKDPIFSANMVKSVEINLNSQHSSCKCNYHYFAKMTQITQPNCIVDGGADTHVVGKG